jgi:hypothetical protein
MKVLNGIALAISGLAFAGMTALTVVPASAQTAVSARHMITENGDVKNDADVTQANDCDDNAECGNQAVVTQGGRDADVDADLSIDQH